MANNYDHNKNKIGNINFNSYEIFDYINDDLREYFDDFTLEKHKKCRPPNEAYLFFPKENELYESNEINESKVFRKIFCVKNFTNYESETLTKFEAFIANFNELNENRKITFSEDWERWDTLKFLEAANYEFKKALQSISDYLDWRVCYFPLELSDKAIEILAFSGFVYCHGRDHNYRPNVFIKAEIYFANLHKYNFDDWQMALVFFFEYVVKVMLIPGQIEQWNLFVDLENVALTALSEDLMKLIMFFKVFYISRVNFIFVFAMNKKLECLHKALLTLLAPATQNKLVFISECNKDFIFSKCNKEQIEQKYGGAAKNIYETVFDLEKNFEFLRNNLSDSSIDISNSSDSNVINFFPPVIPSADFKFSFNEKKFSKSLEKQSSSGKINYITNFSPNLNCDSINVFSTPKVNASRNNVFVYNPNNYKCIQMSELARKNIDRNSNASNQIGGESNKSCFAKLSGSNENLYNYAEKNVSNEAKDVLSKLVPKPLNLKEIFGAKKNFNQETRSESINMKNSTSESVLSKSVLSKNREKDKELIDKIVERDEEYDSSLYEDAISNITLGTNNAYEGETSSNNQVKSSQRRTAKSSKKVFSDFDDKKERTISDSIMKNLNNNNSVKVEGNEDSSKNNDFSFDLTGDLFTINNRKNSRNSNNYNNSNNLNLNNNSKSQGDNRFVAQNGCKLSTILEDNEILNHISPNNKIISQTSNANNSDLNENNVSNKNNIQNNNKNYNNEKNKNAKSESKNKKKNYQKSENNSDRLNDSLQNKINININNNININFNVNDINNVSEQFMSQSQSQSNSGDFRDKMKFFMNRTMRCERNLKIDLSNEESNTSSERNNKFGSKFVNSQSHPDIKMNCKTLIQESEAKKPFKISKENGFGDKINNENNDYNNKNDCKINVNKLINDNEINCQNKEKKEKEALVNYNNNNNNSNIYQTQQKKINEVKKVEIENKDEKKFEKNLAKSSKDVININKPELVNNKIDTAVNKETDNKPKNDRANNFANFFQRLNKTSQQPNSNMITNKPSEEVLKKPDSEAKPGFNNEPVILNQENSKKKIEKNEIIKNEISLKPKKEEISIIAKAEEKVKLNNSYNLNNKIKSNKEIISIKIDTDKIENNVIKFEHKESKSEALIYNEKPQEVKIISIENSFPKAESKIAIEAKIEIKSEFINKNPFIEDKIESKFENTKKKFKIAVAENEAEENEEQIKQIPSQIDIPKENFNQNEIRQKLKLESKLAQKNPQMGSARNLSNLNKTNNKTDPNQISNKAAKELTDEIFENFKKEKNQIQQKLPIKTNTAQSLDLDPVSIQGLLTSRDHVVSVEEEINRCFMLRNNEKSEFYSQSKISEGELSMQLKDKLCKQIKIKMYNLKLTKTPVINSSNTLKQKRNKAVFNLNSENNLNEDEIEEMFLNSPCFNTSNQFARGKRINKEDDNSKRDLCHEELAKVQAKKKNAAAKANKNSKSFKCKINNDNQNLICFDEKDANNNFENNINDDNINQFIFDEENKEDFFENIFNDEVNEGISLKDSAYFKMQNQLSKSKNKSDKLSFNIDSLDRFSFNNFNENDKNKLQNKNGNNDNNNNNSNIINLPNKVNTSNDYSSSKYEMDLENKNFDIASNINNNNNNNFLPSKSRAISESFFNRNNQKQNVQISTFKKTLEKENMLNTISNDSIFNNEFGTKNPNLDKPYKNNNKNESINNDSSHHNYSSLVPNSVANNANNLSLNTENVLNTDIIMDRITKQPCCSSINVEEKCLIF